MLFVLIDQKHPSKLLTHVNYIISLIFVNLGINLRCLKAKKEWLNEKVLALLLKELRHAALLIWSGKLFQSRGAMTEKEQFSKGSRLSSQTTNNSLLVEWSVQGVLLIKESASTTFLTGNFSLVCLSFLCIMV